MVRRLHASHAFHSPMMLPIVEPFRRAVAAVSLRPPTLPFLSCPTGTWIKPDEATSPDYWARHVLEAVRFADAVAVLLGDESFIPIEVGPQLAGATRGATAARPRSPDHRDHASRARRGAVSPFSSALSARRGCPAWRSTFLRWLSNRFPVVLPPYPFQRQRFWIEPGCPSPACRTRALNYAGEAMLRPGSICQPGVASSRCRQVCAPRIAGWFWQSN